MSPRTEAFYRHAGEIAQDLDTPIVTSLTAGPPTCGREEAIQLESFTTPEDLVSVVRMFRSGLKSLHVAGISGDIGRDAVLLSLARALADTGRRILVIDADADAIALAGSGDAGLTDAMKGEANLAEIVQPSPGYEGMMAFLPIGGDRRSLESPGAPEPFERVLGDLRPSFDVVLVSAPCLDRRGKVHPASIACEAVLLVLSPGLVSRDRIRRNFLQLWGVDASIRGIVTLGIPDVVAQVLPLSAEEDALAEATAEEAGPETPEKTSATETPEVAEADTAPPATPVEDEDPALEDPEAVEEAPESDVAVETPMDEDPDAAEPPPTESEMPASEVEGDVDASATETVTDEDGAEDGTEEDADEPPPDEVSADDPGAAEEIESTGEDEAEAVLPPADSETLSRIEEQARAAKQEEPAGKPGRGARILQRARNARRELLIGIAGAVLIGGGAAIGIWHSTGKPGISRTVGPATPPGVEETSSSDAVQAGAPGQIPAMTPDELPEEVVLTEESLAGVVTEGADLPSPVGQEGTGPWDPLESTCRHASLSIL